MTLHLLQPVPATELTKSWEAEAFSARTRVMGSMLAQYGKVILYGGGRNESRVTEYVEVHDDAWRNRHWPGFKTTDSFSDYDPGKPAWIEFNVHVADAIRQRAHPGDTLGITMGVAQAMTFTLTKDLGLIPVELGIGYKGIIPDIHHVFESYAWRTYHHGLMAGRAEQAGRADADTYGDVRNFDTVIPRPYEIDDFPAGDGKGGYFVFMGRVVSRKGALVASQVCQRLGAKLIVVGQNVTSAEKGKITTADGLTLEGDVEFAGVVGPEERSRILGGAIATLTPTLYMEPFGGVHAESLLTGTPVLATDHGCFLDYIEDGVNGFRCSTMAEFVHGAREAPYLDRTAIRERAQKRYGTETVGPQYDRFLRRVRSLRGEGWYSLPLEPASRAYTSATSA